MEHQLEKETPFESIRTYLRIDYTIRSFLGISEESRYLQRIFADIILMQEDNSEIKIGTIEAMRILVGSARNNRANLFDLFDIDEDAMYIGELVWDFEKKDFNGRLQQFLDNDYYGSDILILEHIELIPEYRGRQIGRYAIKDLYNNFIEGCGIFIARFDHDRIEKAQIADKQKSIVRLVAFFNLIGFTMIPELSNELMFINPANANAAFNTLLLD